MNMCNYKPKWRIGILSSFFWAAVYRQSPSLSRKGQNTTTMVGTAERVLDKALALHVAEPGLSPGMALGPPNIVRSCT